MNNFLDTETGKPELKDYYGNESLYEAIRRRRQRMVDKRNIEDKDLQKNQNSIQTEFPDED